MALQARSTSAGVLLLKVPKDARSRKIGRVECRSESDTKRAWIVQEPNHECSVGLANLLTDYYPSGVVVGLEPGVCVTRFARISSLTLVLAARDKVLALRDKAFVALYNF